MAEPWVFAVTGHRSPNGEPLGWSRPCRCSCPRWQPEGGSEESDKFDEFLHGRRLHARFAVARVVRSAGRCPATSLLLVDFFSLACNYFHDRGMAGGG